MSTGITDSTRFRRSPETAWRLFADEAVVITNADQKMHVFNGAATRLWEECESRSFGELVELLRSEFDGPPEIIEQDAREFLEELLARGMIERVNP